MRSHAASGNAAKPATNSRFGPKRAAIPVQVGAVREGQLHVYYGSLGTVTAASSVIVRTRIDGQLMRLGFKEGDTVKAGQLLAEIDPRTYQVQLAQAQGQMAKDQAQLQNARADLARYQGLLAEDSIARQQVDTQQALVRQYEGTLKVDQAQIDSAKLQLTYTRIVAPVGGRLGLRQVDVGNMVHSSDANGIVTINQVQPITVVFTLPEAQLPTVLTAQHDKQKLSVEAWDREQKNLLAKGSVAAVDNQIDTTTGTVKLKAIFANDEGQLFPNQFVNVRLLAQTLTDATIAPAAAVQRGRDGPFVYVVKSDNSVTQRQVKLGAVDGLDMQVLTGLQPGDTVVTDGIDQLREGTKVEIANPAALLKEKPKGKGKSRNGRGRPGEGQSGPRTGRAPADASSPAAAR